jgi:type I restriction enzyme S subunit
MKYEIQNTPQLRFPGFEGEFEYKKLGDTCNIIMGQSPNSKSYNENGEGYYLIQGNADIKNRTTCPRQWTNMPTKICEIGDIILTVRAPVGAVAKSIHNACIGRGVCVIRNSVKYDLEYIYQFLLDFETKWGKLEQGSTFTAVSGNDIKSIKNAFPTLPEQQKIASFLSAVDEKIQQLSRKKELLEQYKKGTMQQLFSGKLRFAAENGEDYPDWEKKKLGEVCEKIGDGLHGTPIYSEDSDIYFVNGNNLANGKIEITEKTKKVNYAIFKKNDKRLNVNTILISLNGTIGNIAKYNNEKLMLGKSVGYFNFKENADFYFHFLKTEAIQNFFTSELTGSTIKNLSLKTLRETEISLPCIEEQQKIANFLTNIDTKIESTSQQINQTQNFKKGLLQQLFV